MTRGTRDRTGGRARIGYRAVAVASGVCVGVSGIDHGIFEMLQGYSATPGLFIESVGPPQRMWVYGTEDAFTIVPNFLATGILAVGVGIAVIVWSVREIGRPGASRIMLGLGGALFLVGGGVGMIPFLLLGWVAARRAEGRPGRIRLVPDWARSALADAVPVLVGVGLAGYAVGVAVAITGYVPGVPDPEQARLVCWGALLIGLAALALAFTGASARVRYESAAGATS